jgi:hypothetical protein
MRPLYLARLIKNAHMQGACRPRSEAYPQVRRSDEAKGNATDGRFSSACPAERFVTFQPLQ